MTVKAVDLIAYSDIHWDKFSNGLTMDDIDAAEDQVRVASLERNKCPILFAGDRFVDSNPKDEVKNRADAAMLRKCKDGIIQFYLVGNHDRWSRAVDSGHTYNHVHMYSDYDNLVNIMDRRIEYYMMDGSIAFHAIPADGFAKEFQFKYLEPSKFPIQICCFHDLYKDSVVDAKSGFRVEGVAHEIMDDARFAFVIGGDNHVPQDLPLKNTTGIHTGSTIQHNWGDSGSPRGFWAIKLIPGQKTEYQFIESCAPKFERSVFVVKELDTFESWVVDQLKAVKDNIARVHLQGPAEIITKIDRVALERTIMSKWGPRRIQVVLEPWVKKLEFSDTLKVSTPARPHSERWEEYVDAKGLARADELKQIGRQMIEKAISQ